MRPGLQTPSLLWGQFDLLGNGTEPGEFDMRTAVDGTDLGQLEQVVEEIGSGSFFGQQVQVTGYANREFELRVTVGANNGETLALVEAAIQAQADMERPPPLVWTSPIAESAPCVFDVQLVELQRVYDNFDLDEMLRGKRTFVLAFTCYAPVRSIESIVVDALPTGPEVPTVTTINAATSTTGWSTRADDGSALSVVSGAVRASRSSIALHDGIDLIWTGPVDMGTQRYLTVDMTGSLANGHFSLLVRADNGAALPLLAKVGNVYYYEPPASWSSVKVTLIRQAGHPTPTSGYVQVADLSRTDVLGVAGNGRQRSRLAEVRGSVPTWATIRVTSESESEVIGNPLPDLLVHTSRNTTWQPNLRPWQVSGGLVELEPSYSGYESNIATADLVYRLPANKLTSGLYALMVAVTAASVSSTVEYEVKITTDGGGATLESDVVLAGEITVDSPGVYTLGDGLPLPPVRLDDTLDDRSVQITLSGSTAVKVDEAWLFGLHDGVLSWIRHDATAVINALEIQSDDLGVSRPSVMAGTNSVVESNVDRLALSFNRHEFRPGWMQVFVAGLATDPLVRLEYFPRAPYHPMGAWLA